MYKYSTIVNYSYIYCHWSQNPLAALRSPLLFWVLTTVWRIVDKVAEYQSWWISHPHGCLAVHLFLITQQSECGPDSWLRKSLQPRVRFGSRLLWICAQYDLCGDSSKQLGQRATNHSVVWVAPCSEDMTSLATKPVVANRKQSRWCVRINAVRACSSLCISEAKLDQ